MTPPGTCPFCSIIAGTAPADVVFQDRDVSVFMPDEPATKGHLLVVPTLHVPDIWSLTPDVSQRLFERTRQVAHLVKNAIEPAGLNIIQSNGESATQSVFHLHVHVVPRYPDDHIIDFWPPRSSLNAQQKADLTAQLRDAAPEEFRD